MSADLENYRQIVENSADAIIIMVDLRIAFANKTALKIYGAISDEELIGKDALSLGILNSTQHGRTQELESRRIQGDLNQGIFEFPATLKDGRKATFEVSVSNLPFQGKTGALCIIRDITTREEASGILLNTLSSLFGLSYAAIGFVENDKLVFTRIRGENIIQELSLDGKGITVRAVNTGKTQVTNDTQSDPDYLDGRLEGDAVTSSELDVPVIVNGEPIAVIAIEEAIPNRFGLEEVQSVEILANHYASALARITH